MCTKFKSVYVAMHSLVMSLLVTNLQCLNLVNIHLHEYSIYTAPGF